MTLGPPDQRRKPPSAPPGDPPTVEDWLAARLAEVSGDDADTEPAPGVELDEDATVHDEVAIEDRPGRMGSGVGRVVARHPMLEEATPDPTTVEHEHPTDPTTALVGLHLDADDDTVGPDDAPPAGVGTGPVAPLSSPPWDELSLAAPPRPPRGEETGFLLQDTDPRGEEHVPTDFEGLPPFPNADELGDEPGTQWESRPERRARLGRAATPGVAPARREPTPAPPPRREPTPGPPPRRGAPPVAPPPEALELAPPPPGGEPEEASLGLGSQGEEPAPAYDEDSPTVVVVPKNLNLTPPPAPLPPAPPTLRPIPPPPEPRPSAEATYSPVAWMISASVVFAVLLGLLVLGLVALGLYSP